MLLFELIEELNIFFLSNAYSFPFPIEHFFFLNIKLVEVL